MNTKKFTLITGANSGIGLEIAKLFTKDSHNLILVSRSREKLQQTEQQLSQLNSGSEFFIIEQDLNTPDAAEQIVGKIPSEFTIENLINNAGLGLNGAFKDTDWQKESTMLQVNCLAPIHLTKLLLPQIIKNQGHILNVASTAAFQPGPFMNIYYATKALIYSFSIALTEEMKEHHVKVSCLCPGPTATGFQAKAELNRSGLFEKVPHTSVEFVANKAYIGLKKGKMLIIPGLFNKFMYFLTKIAPLGFLVRTVANLQRPRPNQKDHS